MADVENWIVAAKMVGIRTIICLLTDDQLRYYCHLPKGLLETYQDAGFKVIHRPVTDPFYNPNGWIELENILPIIYNDFLVAEKPVLVHCSAGVDRSPKAAQFIVDCISGTVELIE